MSVDDNRRKENWAKSLKENHPFIWDVLIVGILAAVVAAVVAEKILQKHALPKLDKPALIKTDTTTVSSFPALSESPTPHRLRSSRKARLEQEANTVGNVTSYDQRGGVTAGVVGNVTLGPSQ